MASLFVIKGRDQGTRFELDRPVLLLGRDTTNPIQLHDTEVSRRHAEIRRDADGFSLVDLESSNGTYVNSEPVRRQALRNGDRLQVGRTLMIFTGPDAETPTRLDDAVNIVAHDQAGDDSRIVHSIAPESGSSFLPELEDSGSPWLARSRSNLQIMYRTALAVSHTLDIDQLLNRILELIFEWVEADRGCIMLMDQGGDELVPKARRNRQGIDQDEKMVLSRRILDYVGEHKEGVLTSNAREDQRWDPGGSIVQAGVREAICVPMQGRYDDVGVIYIDTYTPPGSVLQQGRCKFSDEHLKLMIAIGHQAALAIEDTSYYSAMLQAERLAAVGQTIATLSHHIKNILQGIRGGSYLIEEGLKSDETDVVRKGWDIVEKNQEKISNLVMDMLTFSKEREPALRPSDLNQVVVDVVEMMQVRASEGGVELVWQPAADLPLMTFDPEGLHRAVLNVVTNAIDACENAEQGSVVIQTRYVPEKQAVELSVEDNGQGIQPEDLEKIFTIFESSKGSRGTGLGLSVSQKILREHDGDIEVRSEPDRGSCFTLSLPVVTSETLNNIDDADKASEASQTVQHPRGG